MIRALTACLVLLAFMPPASAAGFDALLHAARTRNLDAVRELVEAGSDPNPPFESYDGYTPLMFAARNGDLPMTRLLLGAGAGTEHRDLNGERALEWATSAYYLHGRADVQGTVRLLLQAGSPADSDDDRLGISPLMHASQYGGDAELVRLLLDAGADPDRIDAFGATALHRAAMRDGPAMAMLLAAGARPDVAGRPLGRTPLHVAAESGAAGNVRLLLAAGAGTEPRYHRGTTALYLAAASGADRAVAALLDAGAEVDAADEDGLTPVLGAIRGRSGNGRGNRAAAVAMLAARTADIDRAFAAAVGEALDAAVSLLLERGAEVDAVDEHGRPAFAAAAARPESGGFSRLLERGVDLQRHGGEALGSAAGAGLDDRVERLLALGVDVDSHDAAGISALMRAAAQGRTATVALLLDRGADGNARDRSDAGVTDHMAAARGLLEAVIARAENARALVDASAERTALARLADAHAIIERLLAG